MTERVAEPIPTRTGNIDPKLMFDSAGATEMDLVMGVRVGDGVTLGEGVGVIFRVAGVHGTGV